MHRSAQVHGEVHLDDVKRLQHPLFVGAAANEWTFPESRARHVEAIVRARKEEHVHRIVRYPNTYHGFALRGDERSPVVARAKDQCMHDVIAFCEERAWAVKEQ